MRRRWVFWAVAVALTAVWVIANLPRVSYTAPSDEFTEWKAGRPMSFVRWTVDTYSGKANTDSFTPGNIVINLVPLAALIAVTWFLTRPRREVSTRPPGT